jgi:hypothetical protein
MLLYKSFMNHIEQFSENRPENRVAPALQGAKHEGHSEVPYTVHGDVAQAKHVIFETADYLTPLSKEHYQLRLSAQQESLGPDFCVVGVEAFSSQPRIFSRTQLNTLKSGDFEPVASRVFRVIDSVGLSEDQTASVGGSSLGGDISIQVAHDSSFNENRGIVEITGLKAIEPARVRDRNVKKLRIAKAFASSGDKFFSNIIESDSVDLLRAFDLDVDDPSKSELKHNIKTVTGILGYWARAPLANLALLNGFGYDTSYRQLADIVQYDAVPAVMVATCEDSTVSSTNILEVVDHFGSSTQQGLVIENNDHSAENNIQESARRQAEFGKLVASAAVAG